MRIIISLSVLFSLCIAGCKKDKPPARSSSKSITSFILRTEDNAGILTGNVTGNIGKDTIQLNLTSGTDLSRLVPAITTTGVSVSPGSQVAQNFSAPVVYTVTAEDGSTKRYIVVVRYLSTEKEILSFTFTAAGNPALAADATGTIRNDTIEVTLAATTSTLVPTIVYKGTSLSPAAGAATSFSEGAVTYTVTAEDGSTRAYKVFVSSGRLVYVYSRDGYVYALDGASGLLRWKTLVNSQYGGYYPPTPGNNGLIYVYGYPLTALDARTGTIVWQNAAATYAGIPVVQNNIVYMSMPSQSVTAQSYFAAFDGTTGALLWKQPVYMPTAFPVAAGSKVYAGSRGNGYPGFYTATGAPAGSLLPGIVQGNPAYANGTLYAGGEVYYVGAFDVQSNSLLWSVPVPWQSVSSAPTVSGDTLFFAQNDTIYEVSISRHVPILKIKMPAEGGGLSNVHVSGGMIYGGSPANYLYAINAASGTVAWRAGVFAPAGVETKQPFAADGIVYAGDPDQYFYAYNTATGTVRWKYPVNSYVTMGGSITDSKGVVRSIALSGQQN